MAEVLEVEARLKNYISGNLDKIQKDFIKVQKQTEALNKKLEALQKQGFGNIFKGMVSAAAVTATLRRGFQLLNQTMSESLELYKIQTNAVQKLDATLKATGNQVGITSKEMQEYAKELQDITTFGDEATIKTQALMVTFTKIGKDIFPEAIKSAQDMSAMFGQDLQQSAIQLGTALNDPIMGVGRLRRIGISFSQTQKDMIENFVEQNDIMGAQKVILDELQAEFGGVAEELAKTDIGMLDQQKNKLDDIKEVIGKDIIPLYQKWAEFQETILKGISSIVASIAKTPIEKVIDKVKEAADPFLEVTHQILAANKEIARIKSGALSPRETEIALELLKIEEAKLIALEKQRQTIIKGETDGPAPTPGKWVDKRPKALTAEQVEAAKKAAKKAAEERIKYEEGLENEILRMKKDANKKSNDARKKEIDDEKKSKEEFAQHQIEAEKVLRDLKLEAMVEGTDKELAIQKAHDQDMIDQLIANEETIDAIKKAASDERLELRKELDEAEKQQKIQNAIDTAATIVSYANNMANSLVNLSRTTRLNELSDEKAKIKAMNISQKEKEKLLKRAEDVNREKAKKEKGIAIGQAIVNTALGVTGALSIKPTALGILMAALVGAAGAAEVATIAAQKFAGGGIVDGHTTGDRNIIAANANEVVLNPRQQAELLFNIANGGGGTTDNSSLNVTFQVGGNADEAALDRMEVMGEKLGQAMVEANRAGSLEDFKSALVTEGVFR